LKNQEDEKNTGAFFERPDSKNLAGSSRVSGLKTLNKRDFSNPSASFIQNEAPRRETVVTERSGQSGEKAKGFFDSPRGGINYLFESMKIFLYR